MFVQTITRRGQIQMNQSDLGAYQVTTHTSKRGKKHSASKSLFASDWSRKWLKIV